MYKTFIALSGLFGALAVGFGAFGAHALKSRLETAGTFDTYQTAVQYHFFHTLALLLVATLLHRQPGTWLHYSGWFFVVGTTVFSGSLYLLCFTGQKWLGAITPIGGLFFIFGWISLLLYALKLNS